MTELAQTYLGNYLKETDLKKRVEQSLSTGCCLEVELTQVEHNLVMTSRALNILYESSFLTSRSTAYFNAVI